MGLRQSSWPKVHQRMVEPPQPVRPTSGQGRRQSGHQAPRRLRGTISQRSCTVMRLVSLLLTLIFLLPGCDPEESRATPGTPLAALNQLDVREWDNDPAYERAAFGPAWADIDRNGCDQRNDILRRDLEDVKIRPGSRGCVVETGKFQDPYDARVSATFRRGKTDVDIDHVVALKNAWLTGAGDWSSGTKGHPGMRDRLANDPLNLIAVWGSINLRKSDSDFAAWQPND